jgi:signal transduction histidine kinase
MLRKLRLRLTLLYTLSAFLLVVLVSSISYSLLNYFFIRNIDFELYSQMDSIFNDLGLSIPEELELNIQEHYASETLETNTLFGGSDNKNASIESASETIDLPYKGQRASIFIMPLDVSGNLLFNPNPFSLPMKPDKSAAEAALIYNYDMRSGKLENGNPVRILTYLMPYESGYEIIQLGLPYGEQVEVLNNLMRTLLMLGVISIGLIGLGAWWLAGRSVNPVENAWIKQQQFIANASHELRTPLTFIRASAEMGMRQSQKKTAPEDLFEDIIAEVDHLSNIVSDLLLLSRLDNEKMLYELEPIEINHFFKEIKRQLSPRLGTDDLEIILQNLDGCVFADKEKLRQVAIILLDNAIRYSPKGGKIFVSSIILNNKIKINITDHGKGIPASKLPQVFERFYQVEDARNAAHQGVGLGLSIAKLLVEGQNGEIAITSEFGAGTTAVITLPSVNA